MKLLFLGNTSWSMWNFRSNLLKRLKLEGHDVFVAAPKEECSIHFDRAGITFIELKNLSRKGLNPFVDLRFLMELCRVFRELQPDVLFCYTIKPNIFGNFAKALTRIRSVSVVTGLGYVFINRSLVTKVAILLYACALRFVDKLIFLNEDDRNEFIDLGIVRSIDDRVEVIAGEGIDVEYFSPSVPGSSETSDLVFLFIGRLLVDKGLREFAEAARCIRCRYPAVRFHVLGPFDASNPAAISENELDKWVLDGRLSYLGAVEDVRGFIDACSVVVLPSYQEGMSRVLMEAIALAKPIITTNVRGCRHFVCEGQNGFLVKPKDSVGLAAAFERFILLDYDRRRNMGAESRKLAVEKFSEEQTFEKYRKILVELNKL